MTERLPPLSTHIVTSSQATALSPKSLPTVLSHVSSKVETVDEEPYTIKCICNFADDDGNTIYCEACDTWQHIECYYPHNIQDAYQEDFDHSCVDCSPRHLDRHSAIERQKLRRVKINTEEEAPERKAKRPPSKTSHKKKTKPSDLQLNGHSGSELIAKHTHEQSQSHGHKKSKSTHRPSQSISSTTAKRSPSYGQKNGSNTNGHPPSPVTTPPDLAPDLEIHTYSNGFLSLYNDELQIVQTNSFASLVISNAMSLWLRDHDKLRHETGCEYDDVFQNLPANIDTLRRTPTVAHKKHLVQPNTELHWQYLKAPGAIEKDIPLVELNGQIGIQKDYCEDPTNRWQELSSPLPFVFFHPMLPLYIDTRREGSLARYVRRSCKPNAVLDTYLSDGSEYHFWLVSDRRIAPDEQITIPWDFRLPKAERKWMLQLLDLSDEESSAQVEFDANQMDRYHTISSWLHAVLSEYGGCACGLGSDCAFVRFHRKYISRSQPKASKKKSRKPKPNAVSPTSTGHATNSRAPSEGHGDDGAENDSGSSRSKPPSRDMTPARQGSIDTLGILTEPTDRDKRKVAMVEDSFRRMEQQQQPVRKKKRTSDGNTSSGTCKPKPKHSTSHTQGVANATGERRYVDVGTNRSTSGSPHSNTSPTTGDLFKNPSPRPGSVSMPSARSSQGPKPQYTDASVQTDVVEGEWFSPVRQTSKVKRRVVSLSKRLLDNRHRQRSDDLERRKMSIASPSSVSSAMTKMDLESPKDSTDTQLASPTLGKDDGGIVATADTSEDTIMTDAPSVSPTTRTALPGRVPSPTGAKVKSPELKVQMPPVPAFNSTNPTVSSVTTPLSASASSVQSPFSANSLISPFGPPAVNGVATHPSPIKKKLSLSDYTKSRKNKTAAAAKPVGGSLKPPTTIAEEAKSPTTTDVVMTDSPTADTSSAP